MSKEYFDAQGYISSSLLKLACDSPKQAYKMIKNEQGDEKSPALYYGSLVDCLLTTPDKFDEDYVVYRGKAPSDKLLDVANEYVRIYQLEASREDFDSNACVISAQNNVGYDRRLKPATMIEKFNTECSAYCTFVLSHLDKVIVDEDAFNEATQLINNTKASRFLTNIFQPDSNIIVLFQVAIFVTTTQFTGKALLDCIVIDLEKKTITPYDFKTFEGSFESNYWKYKYYYQEAWYGFILNTLKNEEFYIDAKYPEQLAIILNPEFTIEQFKFIAIDKSGYKNIEIFESYSNIIEDVFFKGYIDKKTNHINIKSIQSLIEELKWRVLNDSWSDDYEMLNKGVKKLWL